MLVLVPTSVFLDADYSRGRIGHADQAELAQCARNIAEGKGPVVDCIWVVQGEHVPITHGIRYWSLYVAYWVAPFFYLFGATRGTALMAASIAKAIMAVAAYFFVRKSTDRPLAGLACATALLFDETWLRHVNLLSDLYLAVVVLLFSFSLATWMKSGTRLSAGISGLLVGIAIGVKPTGLLLIPLPLLICYFRKIDSKANAALCFLIYVLAIAAGVSGLVLHNMNEGGSPWWPDSAAISAGGRASAVTGETEFHHSAFYDPTIKVESLPIRLRVKMALKTARSLLYFGVRGDLISSWWLPFVVVAFVCGSKLRSRPHMRRSNTYHIVAGAIAALGLPLCGLVHMEMRYWLFIAAPCICLCFCALRGRARIGIYAIVLMSLLVTPYTQFREKVSQYVGGPQADPEEPLLQAYRDLGDYLSKDEIVLTANPWEFTFHTRIRSVVLPTARDPAAVREFADRFSATKIVIVQKDHRSHLYGELAEGRSTDIVECIFVGKGFTIGRLRQL